MLNLNQLLGALDEFAPWELAESWDQVGLQVGHRDQSVAKVMVALDINEQVIQEGLDNQVDGFIVHHPLLFKPLSQIDLSTPLGRCLEKLIKHRLFLIAAHTNADKASEGLNQFLANQFGLTEIKLLEPCSQTFSERLYKIVVFAPEEHSSAIRSAMALAGAGTIGDYTDCSFEVQGSGTFIPNTQAIPFVGDIAHLNQINEIRLEMQVSEKDLTNVIEAIRAIHPYQEPVIDVYSIRIRGKHGMGRIGKFGKSLALKDFCSIVKQKLSAHNVRFTGEPDKVVGKLAICSGSGGSLMNRALKSGADVFLTGELNYHDCWLAKESGLAVVVAGHWATEHCFIEMMVRYMNEYFRSIPDFMVLPSKAIQEEPYETL